MSGRMGIFYSDSKMFIKKTAASIVHDIQSRRWYRKILKSCDLAIDIRERCSETSGTPGSTMQVWDYTAGWRSREVGGVHIVWYPPEDAPFTGFWLVGLWVNWKYRGSGTGEQLCMGGIKRARTEGAEEIHLLVNENNLAAISLYKKIGFEQVSVPAFNEMLLKEKQRTGTMRILMRLAL